MARFNARQTTVVFQDSAASNTITVGPGEGDFSIGATVSGNKERVRLLDRGAFDGFIETDDLEQEFSITIAVSKETLTHATAARIYDFVHKSGSFASANSTSADIWAWKILVTMTDGTTTATLTLPVCQGTISFSEGKEFHTFSISGTNNGAIAVA